MSEIAKSYRESIEDLASNIANIREVFDEEPSMEYICKLREMSEQTMKKMSSIHDYYNDLRDDFRRSYLSGRNWKVKSPDRAKDFYFLRPVQQAYLFLDNLNFGTIAFSRRAEGINQLEIKQDGEKFVIGFGKFWENTKKNADHRVIELRALISKLRELDEPLMPNSRF